MEFYIFVAVGFFLLLVVTGRAEPETPQVIYVVAQEPRGGGVLFWDTAGKPQLGSTLHFSGRLGSKNRASCVLSLRTRPPSSFSAKNGNYPVGNYELFERRALMQSLPAVSLHYLRAPGNALHDSQRSEE